MKLWYCVVYVIIKLKEEYEQCARLKLAQFDFPLLFFIAWWQSRALPSRKSDFEPQTYLFQMHFKNELIIMKSAYFQEETLTLQASFQIHQRSWRVINFTFHNSSTVPQSYLALKPTTIELFSIIYCFLNLIVWHMQINSQSNDGVSN